ncbi:transmembrane anchor protein, partial [Acinetobacter baumannii]
MYNTQIPQDVELPSTKKLVKSTIIAAVSAAVVLVTVVMPAEYNIDP